MSTINEVEKYQWHVDEMRRLAKQEPRTNILGKEFLIYPEVFHPDHWDEIVAVGNAELLKVVKEEALGKSDEDSFDFLEVGCGAGYTAVLVALVSEKCRVWATDINDIAVENTIENAKIHQVDDRLKAVTANVFDHKEISGKKFDMVYWDFPWFGQHTEPGTQLEKLMRSIIDPGYQNFRRYLSQAKEVLKKSGRIFVLFSFDLGGKELFERVVKETGWSYKIFCSYERQQIEVSIVEFF